MRSLMTALAVISFVPCSAVDINDPWEFLCFSPRPLADSTKVIAEAFGTTITCEESAYAEGHSVAPVFPGSRTVVPRSTKLRVTFSRSTGARDALQGVVTTIEDLFPERYAIDETTTGILAVRPVTDSDLGTPLDTRIDVPSTPVDTATVLDVLVTQVSQKRPGVEIHIGLTPLSLAQSTKLSSIQSAQPARRVLDRIIRDWTTALMANGEFFTWHLRYSPGQSDDDHQVFVLEFYKLAVAEQGRTTSLYVECKHPLADAVTLVADHFDVPILFEEPPAECGCELLGHPGTSDVALAGGMLFMHWSNRETLKDILSRLVSGDGVVQSKSSVGTFECKWEGAMPALVPARMKNEKFELVEYRSLLEMNLEHGFRSAPDELTLETLAAIISAESGRTVVAGRHDAGPAEQEVEPENVSIRNVSDAVTLRDLLAGDSGLADNNLSVSLLYDPVVRGHRLVSHRVATVSR